MFSRNSSLFLANVRGNVAMLTALLTPLIMLFVGAGIDFSKWTHDRWRMQEAADSLALRGAREFLLANTTAAQVEAVIDTAMQEGYGDRIGLTSSDMAVSVDMHEPSVTVSFTKTPAPSIILSKISKFRHKILVASTAIARGGMNVCVVALENVDDGAVSATINSQLSADECSILSNSTHPFGVVSSGRSNIRAGLICSGGGYVGTLTNYYPMPTTDCPVYPDPLAERTPPNITYPVFYDVMLGEQSTEVFTAALTDSVTEISGAFSETTDGAMRASDPKLSHTQYELEPGVYEGGLTIASNADVTFRPGIYVIKGGSFAVDMGARVTGKGVGFYLADDEATFMFGPDSKIDFEAPETGPMAGILFFENRSAPLGRTHRIMSNDARNLLGTFYLSRGVLRVSSLLPIADQSAYTVIVARKLELSGSPTLILNANYSDTAVPAPAGVGPVGGSTYLRD